VKLDHSLVLAMAGALALGSAQAQDAVAGKTVFAQCSACHAVDEKNGAGPSLKGIVGRASGSVAGFRYSRALIGVRHEWDVNSLDAFIANPQKAIPGNAMPFSGLPDASQRANLIAYLQTLQ
jgi:cytochrome c